MSWQAVFDFERVVSQYFGAPYGIAVDSCTHGLELCLRYNNVDKLIVPKRTYISIPFLANKLDIPLEWKDEVWKDYYEIGATKIYDAAVLWRQDSYIPNTFMCISFQFQKHLSLGRGGMILLDNKNAKNQLIKMSYDGRERNSPWRQQNIKTFGYHYYMTPEIAKLGLAKFEKVKNKIPRDWGVKDWPDLTKMEIFK